MGQISALIQQHSHLDKAITFFISLKVHVPLHITLSTNHLHVHVHVHMCMHVQRVVMHGMEEPLPPLHLRL